MKLAFGAGVFIVGMLVVGAVYQARTTGSAETKDVVTRGRHYRSLWRHAKMDLRRPAGKSVTARLAMFSQAAFIPGGQMGTLLQTGPTYPVYKFSDPLAIRNPWLPLATLIEDVLDGTVNGQTDHIERSILQGQTRTFMVNGAPVQTLIQQDKESVGGQLAEIAWDYFAQDDTGAVHYFGESVNQYTNGHISGHSGAWLYGVDTLYIGTIFPGYPKVGQTWEAENVPSKGVGVEHDFLLSTNTTITVPAGTFRNCMETLEDTKEGQENKWYCPSVGTVEEFVSTADVVTLTSHRARYTLP